jgi:DNA invertase Pin-like site-specific DNA recombinase
MARVGYARVSTADQNLDLQVSALRSAGCEKIFEDQGISGATEKRPGLNAAFRSLKAGDTLIVWRLDRLGRSIRHLIEIITRLQKRGVEFRSVTENIDTTSAGGRMIFHVIAAMAEFERSLISERTIAGMAAARERGQHFGRKPSLTAAQCQEAFQSLYRDGAHPAEVASKYRVHPRTLKRLIRSMAIDG